MDIDQAIFQNTQLKIRESGNHEGEEKLSI